VSRTDVSFAQEGDLAQVARVLVRKIVRHKLLFTTTFLAIVAVGTAGTLSLRPKYTAQATIAVLPGAADPLGPSGSDPQNLRDDEVATQASLITSRDLALTVMKNSAFAAAPPKSFMSHWPLAEEALCANPHWPLLVRLCAPGRAPDLDTRVSLFLGALTASPTPRTRLIDLSLTGPEPQVAADTLNELVTVYQREQLKERTADLTRTAQWLSSRAEDLRQVWLNAERRAGEFRAGNGLLPTSGADGASQPLLTHQIMQAASALATAQGELAAARARLGELNGPVQGRLSSIKLPDEPGLTSLASQLATLRGKRASLEASQGSRNPNVIALDREIGALSRQVSVEQTAALGRLSADVRAKEGQVAEAQRALDQLRAGASKTTASAVSLSTLEDEAKSARVVFETFLARARQLDDRTELLRPQVQMASHAVVSPMPTFPNVPRLLAGSIVFGLLGGALAVLLKEGLGNGFSDIGTVAAQVGLPLVCCVPRVSARHGRQLLAGPGSRQTFSAITESMRTLAAQLAFSNAGVAPRSVAIVSAMSQEGKTTTALWLAASIARSGRRVLVLDGDHRRGAVGDKLGDNTGLGLSDVIFDKVDVRDCIKRERAGLFDYISAGRPTARTFGAEELARMRALLEEMKRDYDLVVVDTPPMLAMPEVLLYASTAETTLLLCRWKRTAPQAVASCAQRLEDCGARILGVALTMVDHDKLAQFSEEYSARELRMLKRFYIAH